MLNSGRLQKHWRRWWFVKSVTAAYLSSAQNVQFVYHVLSIIRMWKNHVIHAVQWVRITTCFSVHWWWRDGMSCFGSIWMHYVMQNASCVMMRSHCIVRSPCSKLFLVVSCPEHSSERKNIYYFQVILNICILYSIPDRVIFALFSTCVSVRLKNALSIKYLTGSGTLTDLCLKKYGFFQTLYVHTNGILSLFT